MLNIAIKAAREASKITKYYSNKEKGASFKKNNEILTEVDKKVEEKIKSIIFSKFPGHSFWGEENEKIETGSKYCWIVDPIDGTLNYYRGIGYYGISIALAYEGESILGVVFNPITDELFTAEKGKGAFLNEEKIFVSKREDLSRSIIYLSKLSKSIKTLNQLSDKIKTIRITGSSAYDMCLVACGRVEGFIKTNGSPWGLAAAGIIIEEAGGSVKNLDGTKWNVMSKDVIMANKYIHSRLSSILK